MIPPLTGIAPLCAVLFLGAALTYPWLRGESLMRSAVKTTAIAALVLWALSLGAYGLAAALAFSAFGDWFLSRPGPRAFLYGMAAFAAAHLVYIGLFVAILNQTGAPPWPDPRFRGALLLFGLGLWMAARILRAAGPMRRPVALYGAVLLVMAVLAMMMPPNDAGHLIGLGAVLFVISDVLIGRERFLQTRWPGQGLAIWALYCTAQACVAMGLVGLTV
ncbi:lysoplasmalogenase family protein [Primorskyibacter sp. 2E107]|uniref:lysoplasmalogenase family protein n=1 Tax=Primorskyibacter sp. 2E107 TaxID=3403458 RepID=UPI003AF531F0